MFPARKNTGAGRGLLRQGARQSCIIRGEEPARKERFFARSYGFSTRTNRYPAVAGCRSEITAHSVCFALRVVYAVLQSVCDCDWHGGASDTLRRRLRRTLAPVRWRVRSDRALNSARYRVHAPFGFGHGRFAGACAGGSGLCGVLAAKKSPHQTHADCDVFPDRFGGRDWRDSGQKRLRGR